MSVPVPEGVEFSYAGFSFGPYITTKVTEEPVTSGDGRTVKYSRIKIAVSGVFTQIESGEGKALDRTMMSIRRQLQKHGQALVYVYKGYGTDLRVNAPGSSVRDVAMGPRAGVLRWWPLGGVPGCYSAGFEWEVTTTIPECESAMYRTGTKIFTEVSFSVTYETDINGLVTITSNGKAEIPLSLQSDNTLEANIDSFITDILRPVPTGFQRLMRRQLAPDRRSCTFTITDRQLELPYPDDVVEIDMEHRVRQMNLGAEKWDNTISGTIRMSPTAEKKIAWFRFHNIVAARIVASRAAVGPKNILPPTLEFSENLFKNSARFSIRYTLIGSSISTILLHSGLWRPVGTDFTTWATSLAGNAQAPLGILGERFSRDSDVLIDVCNYPTTATPGNNSTAAEDPAQIAAIAQEPWDPANDDAFEPASLLATTADQITGGDGSGLEPNPIDPDTSWVYYSCTVHRLVDHNIVRHKPLAGTVTYTTPTINPTGAVGPLAHDTAAPTFGVSTDTPDILQQIASPSVTLRVTGYAVRLGYRINPPRLISFGGQTPVLAYESTPETTLGAPGGAVYFRTDWDLTYYVPQPPAAVDVLANPLDGNDGSTASGFNLQKVIRT